ncbi:MAG: hypothetical protein ACLFT3_15210, partial [Cyclobacteriaceae bacterium]
NDRGQAVEIRINKQVTIIGPGYFLGANQNTQASNLTASIQDLNIGEGADGTTITGVDFSSRFSNIVINTERFDGSRGNDGPSNISFIRNAIHIISIVDATNTLISQNFFQTSNSYVGLYANAGGTIIRNNIISSSSSSGIYGWNNVNLSNTVIENNTIRGNISRINGATIQNNIFINGIFDDSDNNTVNNNLFTTTQDAVFPGNSTINDISDNVYSAIISDIFVVPSPSVDNEFRLAEDSPAVGQGVNGVDLGAFGGAAPYRLSGVPSIPAIYELSTTGVGTPSDGMRVQIKARANN